MPPRQKKDGPEYRLLITPEFNEREQRYKTLFVLETVQMFSTFRYELSVQEMNEGKKIHFKIIGLNAPQLTLPAAGHAQFSREYDNLRGVYEVSIEGLDGTLDTFSVKITPEKIKLLKVPPASFVELHVDRTEWSKM
jgi:hypothetical protein